MDPWHVLSVTQDLGPSVSALLIPNASHCLDMAPERPSDTPSLRLGRQVRQQQKALGDLHFHLHTNVHAPALTSTGI